MDKKTLDDRLTAIFDKLVAANDGKIDMEDTWNAAGKALQAMPQTQQLLESFDRISKTSKKRRAVSIYVLAELGEIPGVQERLIANIHDSDPTNRGLIVQTIGGNQLISLAHLINYLIIDDPDRGVREFAIGAAAKLKSEECLISIIRLGDNYIAKNSFDELANAINWALMNYADERGLPFLWYVMNRAFPIKNPSIEHEYWGEKNAIEIKSVSAWGIYKIKKNDLVLKYLIDQLKVPRCTRPGQALCDIYGWDDLKGLHSIDDRTIEIKKRLKI